MVPPEDGAQCLSVPQEQSDGKPFSQTQQAANRNGNAQLELGPGKAKKVKICRGCCVGITEIADCEIGAHRQESETRRSPVDWTNRDRGTEALSEAEKPVYLTQGCVRGGGKGS